MAKFRMSHRVFFSAFALIAIFCSSHVSGWQGLEVRWQEQQAEELNGYDLQVDALRFELNLLGGKLDLDDKLVEELFDALDVKLKAAAESSHADSESIFANRLDWVQREQLLASALELLPKDKHDAVRKYLGNERLLQELLDRNAIRQLLIYLDNQFCLSEQQLNQLGARYSENWDSKHVLSVQSMSIYGISYPGIVGLVSEAEFQEILSETQYSRYQQMDGFPTPLKLLGIAVSTKQEELDLDEFKSMCDTALETRIDELKRVASIDDRQAQRLNIGRKGAVSQVAERWILLVNQMNERPSMTFELRASITQPLVAQLSHSEPWQQILNKTLDESQLEKVIQRECDREKMVTENLIEMLVLMMNSEGLPNEYSMEQHRNLLRMVRENVQLKYPRDYLSLAQQIAQIENERFSALMNDDQWEDFKPELKKHRDMIRIRAEKFEGFGAEGG